MAGADWRERAYWRWWWRQRVTFEAKLVIALALCSPLFAYLLLPDGSGGSDASPRTTPAGARAAIFAEAFDGPLRAESSLYDRWKKLNPVEAAAYERYADAVKLGLPSRPPVGVRTPLGQALVAAARLAGERPASGSLASDARE